MKCISVLWHGISSKNPFSVVWPAIKLALVTLVNGCHKNEVDCWTHWQTTNWLTFSFWRVDGWQVYCVETAIFTSHTKTLGREAAAWILLPHFHAHEITLKTNGTWPTQQLLPLTFFKRHHSRRQRWRRTSFCTTLRCSITYVLKFHTHMKLLRAWNVLHKRFMCGRNECC